MKILSKVVLLASLACVGAMADGMFFGVEGGVLKNTLNLKNADADAVKYGRAKNIGIKFGTTFADGWARAYANYNYTFAKGAKIKTRYDEASIKTSTHELLANIDFTPKLTENFSLFVGGFFGSSLVNNSGEATDKGVVTYGSSIGTTSLIIQKNTFGAVAGARAGVLINVNQNNQIELGYKISKTVFRDATLTKSGAYAGYNFKF